MSGAEEPLLSHPSMSELVTSGFQSIAKGSPMLPSIAKLSKTLAKISDGTPQKLLKSSKSDHLSEYDAENRKWLLGIQESYMSMLAFRPMPMGALDSFMALRNNDKLTAAVQSARRMLALAIAGRSTGELINEHRYIIDNVRNNPETASLTDRATVHFCTVLGLMTLVMAPPNGSTSMTSVFDAKAVDIHVKAGREKLQRRGDGSSTEDAEAGEAIPTVMGVDASWFADDIKTQALFLFNLSHHLKSFKPEGKSKWLEQRTMAFFSNFLTEVVSVLSSQADNAKATQAKIYGTVMTGAFTVVNVVMHRLERAEKMA